MYQPYTVQLVRNKPKRTERYYVRLGTGHTQKYNVIDKETRKIVYQFDSWIAAEDEKARMNRADL